MFPRASAVSKHDVSAVMHTAAVKHCCSVTHNTPNSKSISKHTRYNTAYIHEPYNHLPKRTIKGERGRGEAGYTYGYTVTK